MSLGERIKERRLELGLDVMDIATACGISKQAVYDWERGETEYVRPDNLVAAANRLKTTCRWLVTGKGPRERYAALDEMTQEEDTLLTLYRLLTTGQQRVIHALLEELGGRFKG